MYKPRVGMPGTWGKYRRTAVLGCSECGKDFPFNPDHPGALKDHLVSEHGYIREGAQVFKRFLCEMCQKPALHRYGVRSFCSDHKIYAQQIAAGVVRYVDKEKSDAQKLFDEVEKRTVSSEKHHSAKGKRKTGVYA